jgi:hypothetical protein
MVFIKCVVLSAWNWVLFHSLYRLKKYLRMKKKTVVLAFFSKNRFDFESP